MGWLRKLLKHNSPAQHPRNINVPQASSAHQPPPILPHAPVTEPHAHTHPGQIPASVDNIPEDNIPPPTGEEFTYTALTHARAFRLLRLKRNPYVEQSGKWFDCSLYGSVVEASLDAPPEYFALSYTWGAPHAVDNIVLDGKNFGLTKNCGDALRRMLKGKWERTMWVDSICINQADDSQALQERGGQVALMDEIYRSAMQVNVHLGRGDEKTDLAVASIKNLANSYLAAKLAQKSGILVEKTKRKYEAAADEALEMSAEFPYGKLHPLFSLPWFRRTWVVQEVACARKCVFYCGEHMLAFDSLVVAADFTRLPYSKLSAASHHWKSYLDWHHSLAEFIRRREQGEEVKLDLLSILFGGVLLDATRPEDKIHALYGCARRLGHELPVPDYTKSVVEVYTAATIACIREAQDYEVFLLVEGGAADQLGLPTWVLNLSRSMKDYTLDNPPSLGGPGRRQNKALCGDSVCEWELLPDARRLKVRGRRVDRVAAVSEPWRIDARTTLLGGAASNTGQILTSLVDCIESWLNVVARIDIGGGAVLNAAQEYAAIQRLTQVLTTGFEQLTAPQDKIAEYLSVLLQSARSSETAIRSRLLHPEDGIMQITRFGQVTTSLTMMRVVEQLMHASWMKILRTVNQGYLGMGSWSAQPGDLVVVLHGMATPCLVRPCADGFRFVSVAYVDGIMNGEFWNAGSDMEDEWFVLI
ncbi:hypothetical protein ACN47E_001590 [Coniothyrium glycines]